MKPNNEVIVRTVVLAVTWLNMVLSAAGWNPLPYTDTEVGEAASLVLAFVASIWAWWKNNSVSREAREADTYMRSLKAKRDREEAGE